MKSGANQPPEKAAAPPPLTHPERVIDRASGCTKADLARYYAAAAPLILPHLAGRPVALLRAPDGVGGETFFQKHLEGRALPGVTLLDEKLDPGHPPLLTVDSEAALIALVQMNMARELSRRLRKLGDRLRG